MLSLTAPEDHRWRLVTLTCAVTLAMAAIAFVPPGSLPYPPAGEYSDAAISHWPNAYFLRHSVLDDGRWPLWNPNRMLGQPFAANPLSKVWYPPQWLVLIIPPTLHLNLLLYLHMAWLGIGAVGWGRASRLYPLAAALIALAWGLNPKLVGHLGAGHLDIVYALAWTPWLMWAVRRAVSETSLRNGALTGGAAALVVLADLRIAFYMIPVAALYALTLSLIERRPVSRSWYVWVVALVLTPLLTAVQIVPLITISPALTRAAITPQEAAVYSLPPARLIGLFIRAEGDFHEWVVYTGLPTLALAMMALLHSKSHRSIILWWGLAVAAALWSLGDYGPLFMPVVDSVPLAAWVRVPPRAWFVVGLGLTTAAGHGLDALIRHGTSGGARLAAVGTVGGGAVWFGAAWALSGLIGRMQAARLAGDGLILLSTGMGIVLLGLRRSPSLSPANGRLVGGIGGAFLIVTLVLSLLALDLTLIRARMMTDIEREEQAILDQIADGCDYVYSPTFELIGPATARAGVRTLHGVDPFQLQQHARLIAQAAGVRMRGYSVIAPPLPPGEANVAALVPNISLLRGIGVCAVVSDVPLSMADLDEVSRVGGTIIYQVAEGPERTVEVMGEGDYNPTADFIGLGITAGTLAGLSAVAITRRKRPVNG